MLYEYIWIDGNNDIRSKTRVLDMKITKITELPYWTFDGSSTDQASANKSDLILKPIAIFNDPFRGTNNYLVLCEVYDGDKPHISNYRYQCNKSFQHQSIIKNVPWFGIEQEYVIFDRSGKPYGWNDHNNPGCGEQGSYYCSAGGDRTFGRDIVEEHLQLCLAAGLKISGINAEVMPSQWEFQIGPLGGIEVSDQLWIARYILKRVTEKYRCYISFHPKPYIYDEKNIWNGSGAHTNYSTLAMRNDGGIEHIYTAIKKLLAVHELHITNYGCDNEKRLSGKHETSDISNFTYADSDRSSSIRIPVNVKIDGKGYLEDRRPGANMNPYIVTTLIAETTILKP